MKDSVFFALMFSAAVIAAGCLGTSGAQTPNFYQCGTDIACFKTQAQDSCGPANATVTKQGLTLYAEVTPKEEGACNVFVQLRDVVLDASASDEDRTSLENSRPLFPLANMNCKVAKADAALIDQPSFFTQNSTLEKCEGLFKDQVRKLLPMLKTGSAPSPTPTARSCDLPNAVAIMRNGACTLVSCLPGFRDADGAPANGCEALAAQSGNLTGSGGASPNGSMGNGTATTGSGGNATNAGDDNQTPSPGATAAQCASDGQCNDNNQCTRDSCVDGRCTRSPLANAACNDADPCTYGDYCNAYGVCAGTPVANCNNGLCSLPHASSSLSNGTCVITSCQTPYANCNQLNSDGCETNPLSDRNNCGSCGTACRQGESCVQGACTQQVCSLPNANAALVNGSCAISTCNANFANCDGNAANGCEVNTLTDLRNCGLCAHPCPPVANGASSCNAGACGIAFCNAGYANCDGNAANGCEVNTVSDMRNCGACGVACAANQTCAQGRCA